jgi:hypothetical protein
MNHSYAAITKSGSYKQRRFLTVSLGTECAIPSVTSVAPDGGLSDYVVINHVQCNLLSRQCLFYQFPWSTFHGYLQCQLMPRLRHFSPRFPQNAQDLVLVMFLFERCKLIIQKNETCHILEYLRLLVLFQILFAYQTCYPFRRLRIIPRVYADLLYELGLSLLEESAPAVVAWFCHWVRRARDFPTAEMLGANGEAEVLGSRGGALVKVRGAFLRVVEFVRQLFVVDGDLVWVESVRCVNGCESFVERCGHWGYGDLEIKEGDMSCRDARRRMGGCSKAYRVMFDLSVVRLQMRR